MTQESKFALLGLWSVLKTVIISAGFAYFIGARVTDVMSAVAMWYIWADRIMKEEMKAKEARP